MKLKNKEAFIQDLGQRMLEDAEKLRLFIPDHCAIFWFVWAGKTFKVEMHIDAEKDDENVGQRPHQGSIKRI